MNKQTSNQTQKRPWAALWSVLLLAPLSMAPKGCEPVVIGNDCPPDKACTAGSAGSQPTASAGAAGKPTGNGGSAGKPGPSNGGSGGDQVCGGLLGKGCAADEYCAFETSAACGAADQTGVCKSRPEGCPDIAAPVCACDGQTYDNECMAAFKGSSVLHNGACDEPSPGNTCGGLKPSACAKSEYCNYPPGAQCGAADQTGTCTRIPDACDANLAPVCGCDGATYSNDCLAARNGVPVLHTGACEPTTPGTTCGGLLGSTCANKNEFCNFPIATKCGSGDQTGTCTVIPNGCTKEFNPVCGCDGNTYGNACTAAAAGISVAAQGACGVTCGANTGVVCPKGQYCNYPLAADCGSTDGTGTCAEVLTGGCLANYDPVCGCDGHTYGNACEAGRAGMSIHTQGACP